MVRIMIAKYFMFTVAASPASAVTYATRDVCTELPIRLCTGGRSTTIWDSPTWANHKLRHSIGRYPVQPIQQPITTT